MATPTHALVLTAGLGLRLRPLTFVRAKPAIPVAGEPLVRRILKGLAAQGVSDVVLNLHHLPATLTSVVGDGADLGVRVRYSWEQPLVLGSAGGVRRALDLIESQTFFIVNGDTLTDVDLNALAAFHDASGAMVTLALTPNLEPHRYGGVRLDDRSRVTGFVSRNQAADASMHFIGVQVANADAFASVPVDRPTNSIGGAYNDLLAGSPGCIAGFVSGAAFWDIGTTADYIRTVRALSGTDGSAAGGEVRIDPTADIRRSILWDNIQVGAGAVLDECIVTDGVNIPARAHYRRSILRSGQAGALIVDPLEHADD